MLVRDIMTSPPVTASPDLTVLDAARLMTERNIGSLVVQEGARPVGILTERDLVGKVVAAGLDPKDTHIRELMSSPLLTIAPEMDVMDAARTMARHHVRRLPVLNGGGSLLGIVSERDILEVSPDLIEVTRTLKDEEDGTTEEPYVSKCEGCSCLTDGLRTTGGLLLCEDCWEEQRPWA